LKFSILGSFSTAGKRVDKSQRASDDSEHFLGNFFFVFDLAMMFGVTTRAWGCAGCYKGSFFGVQLPSIDLICEQHGSISGMVHCLWLDRCRFVSCIVFAKPSTWRFRMKHDRVRTSNMLQKSMKKGCG